MIALVDCVLINSPDELYSEHYIADPKMPLGLLYIASYLQSHGANVSIIDCYAHKYTPERLIQTLKNYNPSLVGLNIATPNRRVVCKLAEMIKEKMPRTMVIIGGPHATCLPQDVIKHAPHIDGIVLGEGEQVVLRVLNNLPRIESFPGFYATADTSATIKMDIAPRIEDLDSLPMPAYDLIDVKRYVEISPELYVAASRGCPYNCSFCSSPVLWERNVVFRSFRNVLKEILFLKDKYAISSFYFYDANILIWPELKDFCEKISQLDIRWTAEACINDLDKDLIPLLAKAKCYRLSFGLESGSRKIQEYIGKIIEDDAKEKITKLWEFGIASRAFFIIGFPNETIHDIVGTAQYIIDLCSAGLSDIAIFPCRPYPGARLFQDYLNIYGNAKMEQLLQFEYVEDYKNESDGRIKAKLHRYDTIPHFQINRHFSSLEIRSIIKAMYEIFYNYKHFINMSNGEIRHFLLSKVGRKGN